MHYITKCIFSGEHLEDDQLHIQARIEQIQDRKWFVSDHNEYEMHWIEYEEKMVKSFLHLEDLFWYLSQGGSDGNYICQNL